MCKQDYKTIRVLFSKPIEEIETDISDFLIEWRADTLKEHIEQYESVRFTKIGENEAIITAQYNMFFVTGFLKDNCPMIKIEELD